MTPFKIGLIGGGSNSAVGKAHLAAMRMDGRWTPVAGCFSRDAAMNSISGLEYNVPVFSNCRLMLKEVDAVVVLTPTPTHFHHVMQLLEYSIPVICEKALAMSSAEAERIRSYCHRGSKFLAVVYNYSGYPMVRAMRRAYELGMIGKITHFVAEMPQEGYALEGADPQVWRKHEEGTPMIHLDLTVHIHQLLRYVADVRPRLVSAMEQHYTKIDVIDNATALVRCDDGVTGTIWVSKASLGDSNGLRLRLYGTEGSIEWYQQNPDAYSFSTAKGVRQTINRGWLAKQYANPFEGRFKAGHPTGFVEALGTLYSDIADCLEQYKQTGEWQSQEVFGAAMAHEGLRLCEAIHKSAQTRQWEDV